MDGILLRRRLPSLVEVWYDEHEEDEEREDARPGRGRDDGGACSPEVHRGQGRRGGRDPFHCIFDLFKKFRTDFEENQGFGFPGLSRVPDLCFLIEMQAFGSSVSPNP